MNTLLKVGASSALTLAAIAAHASIAIPSSGAGDAILFAEVVNAAGTQAVASYAGDTGVSVATLAAGLASGSSTNYLAGDANLQKLFAADGSGDIVVYGILGGSYTGALSNSNIGTPGKGNFISTSTATTAEPGGSTFNLDQVNTSALKTLLGSLAGTIQSVNSNSGGAASIEGPVPATAGVWDDTLSTGAATGYGFFSNGNAVGSAVNLFDITGAGTSPAATATNKIVGTASLVDTASGAYLTLAGASTGTPTVPLPAAVWLLGSGLLGLTGVARRKLKA